MNWALQNTSCTTMWVKISLELFTFKGLNRGINRYIFVSGKLHITSFMELFVSKQCNNSCINTQKHLTAL